MKKLLLIIALTIFGLGLNAQNVGDETTIDYDGYSLKYEITSVSPAECKVSDCTGSPTEVTIPSTVTISGIEFAVTSIGDWAFSECSSLTSIEIPNSVTSIGESTFYFCESLRVIKCHAENVPETGDDVFYACPYGIIICVPENSVEDYKAEHPWNNYNYYITAMSEISVIEYDGYSLIYIITDEENTECMVSCAQEPTMPTSITIPSSVEIKGIEYSVTSIGSDAFYYCRSLTSVTFGENSQLISIGDLAFRSCSSLTSIEIPNSVTSIGDLAFLGCSSLTSIEIPNSVTSIGYMAFSDCSSLKVIKCYAEDVPETGDDIFYDCPSDMTIYVPEVSLENYKATYPWNKFIILPLNDNENLVPATPDTLFAETLNDTTVVLTWSAVNSVLGYNVYSVMDSTYTLLADSISDTTYTVNGLLPDSTYCFAVAAFNQVGESERKSVTVKTLKADDGSDDGNDDGNDNPTDTIVPAPTVPATPDTLFAEATNDTTVVLTWSAVDSVLGYNVYSVIDSTYTLLADSISDTTYTVKGLLPDSTYCFAVATFNEVGESERKSVSVTTPKADDGNDDGNNDGNDDENENPTDTIVPTPTPEPLDAPENLVVTPVSTSSIILTWDVVENAESYNVYRDGDMITNVTNPTYTDKDLEYNTKYCYEVTAVRGDEESDDSNQECVKTLGESIEELSSSIDIYPNPVENDLFIATEVRVNEVSIYDVYGRLCRRDASNASTSTMDTFNVSVQDLEAGVYFVKVVTNEGEIVKRFVKK